MQALAKVTFLTLNTTLRELNVFAGSAVREMNRFSNVREKSALGVISSGHRLGAFHSNGESLQASGQ